MKIGGLHIEVSSYYAFLHNINTNQYEYMINDESYAICSGGFPLYEAGIFLGTLTVTGCRPNEDHQLAVLGLSDYIYVKIGKDWLKEVLSNLVLFDRT